MHVLHRSPKSELSMGGSASGRGVLRTHRTARQQEEAPSACPGVRTLPGQPGPHGPCPQGGRNGLVPVEHMQRRQRTKVQWRGVSSFPGLCLFSSSKKHHVPLSVQRIRTQNKYRTGRSGGSPSGGCSVGGLGSLRGLRRIGVGRGSTGGIRQGQDEDEAGQGRPQGSVSPSSGPQLGGQCLWEASEVAAGAQPQMGFCIEITAKGGGR